MCILTDSDKSSLRTLHKNFIITYIDKSPHNFAFICKKHYINTLILEHNTPTYKHITDTQDSVIQYHKDYTKSLSLQYNKRNNYNKLPYSYTSHKATKQNPNVRFIAGSFNCSLTPLSTFINKVMRHLLPSIRQLWNITFTKAGLKPHPLWMINSTNEIPHRIQLLNRKFKIESAPSFNINFSTYDVKTLYTNLPQDDILEKLTQLFNEISRLKNPSAPSSTL